MATKKPDDVDAFGEVFGVGRAKVEAYAESFLAVIGAAGEGAGEGACHANGPSGKRG
ncbi:MAG: HRDC domain-containing protein [Pseudomonadota bacterium]